ncbi:unnamed protein product [Amoebophrya sp. A25]|nr:unnamed protein product [Amoebophrya sp. A25]|eukprot:GSA25T00007558001.1
MTREIRCQILRPRAQWCRVVVVLNFVVNALRFRPSFSNYSPEMISREIGDYSDRRDVGTCCSSVSCSCCGQFGPIGCPIRCSDASVEDVSEDGGFAKIAGALQRAYQDEDRNIVSWLNILRDLQIGSVLNGRDVAEALKVGMAGPLRLPNPQKQKPRNSRSMSPSLPGLSENLHSEIFRYYYASDLGTAAYQLFSPDYPRDENWFGYSWGALDELHKRITRSAPWMTLARSETKRAGESATRRPEGATGNNRPAAGPSPTTIRRGGSGGAQRSANNNDGAHDMHIPTTTTSFRSDVGMIRNIGPSRRNVDARQSTRAVGHDITTVDTTVHSRTTVNRQPRINEIKSPMEFDPPAPAHLVLEELREKFACVRTLDRLISWIGERLQSEPWLLRRTSSPNSRSKQQGIPDEGEKALNDYLDLYKFCCKIWAMLIFTSELSPKDFSHRGFARDVETRYDNYEGGVEQVPKDGFHAWVLLNEALLSATGGLITVFCTLTTRMMEALDQLAAKGVGRGKKIRLLNAINVGTDSRDAIHSVCREIALGAMKFSMQLLDLLRDAFQTQIAGNVLAETMALRCRTTQTVFDVLRALAEGGHEVSEVTGAVLGSNEPVQSILGMSTAELYPLSWVLEGDNAYVETLKKGEMKVIEGFPVLLDHEACTLPQEAETCQVKGDRFEQQRNLERNPEVVSQIQDKGCVIPLCCYRRAWTFFVFTKFWSWILHSALATTGVDGDDFLKGIIANIALFELLEDSKIRLPQDAASSSVLFKLFLDAKPEQHQGREAALATLLRVPPKMRKVNETFTEEEKEKVLELFPQAADKGPLGHAQLSEILYQYLHIVLSVLINLGFYAENCDKAHLTRNESCEPAKNMNYGAILTPRIATRAGASPAAQANPATDRTSIKGDVEPENGAHVPRREVLLFSLTASIYEKSSRGSISRQWVQTWPTLFDRPAPCTQAVRISLVVVSALIALFVKGLTTSVQRDLPNYEFIRAVANGREDAVEATAPFLQRNDQMVAPWDPVEVTPAAPFLQRNNQTVAQWANATTTANLMFELLRNLHWAAAHTERTVRVDLLFCLSWLLPMLSDTYHIHRCAMSNRVDGLGMQQNEKTCLENIPPSRQNSTFQATSKLHHHSSQKWKDGSDFDAGWNLRLDLRIRAVGNMLGQALSTTRHLITDKEQGLRSETEAVKNTLEIICKDVNLERILQFQSLPKPSRAADIEDKIKTHVHNLKKLHSTMKDKGGIRKNE